MTHPNHSCCGCSHSHEDEGKADHADTLSMTGTCLFPFINVSGVETQNATPDIRRTTALKPHSDACKTIRHGEVPLQSDTDGDVLLHVPFTSVVRVRAICLQVAGASPSRGPQNVRIYTNRSDLCITSCAEIAPVQEITLASSSGDDPAVTYTLKAGKFNAVRSITLFFPSVNEDDVNLLWHVGFLGESTGLKANPVAATAVYESSPGLADHKNRVAQLMQYHANAA